MNARNPTPGRRGRGDGRGPGGLPGALRAAALLLAGFATAAPVPAPAAAMTPPAEMGGDTVWEGTVEIGQGVRVLRGATLLIRPGTTVRFSSARDAEGRPAAALTIHGTLVAQGTPGEPILFASADPDAAAGAWAGIVLDKANERPSRIDHATVRHAAVGITVNASVLGAEDVEIRDCGTGVHALQESVGTLLRATVVGNRVGVHYHQSSGPALEECTVTGNAEVGVACILSSSPVVRFSTLADNGSGIVCYQGSSPLVEGNTIRGSERGVHAELQSRPRIVRNTLTGNRTAISGEKMVFPAIIGNVISGNDTGIYCNFSAYPQIHGNVIRDNRAFGLVLGDNMSIVMEKKLPFRHMGRAYFKEPPEESKHLPEKTRRFLPFEGSDEGIVDARGNWWGPAATEEMERLGEKGNISAIEDFYDKPDTWEGAESYRRDRVVFAPWEKAAPEEVGPPASIYGGVRGKVVSGGAPVAGVRVHAYPDPGRGFRGEGLLYSAPTSRDGSFALTLAPKDWHLVVKGPDPPFPAAEPGEGAWYGAYGANPVTVAAGAYLTIELQAARRGPAVVTPPPAPPSPPAPQEPR